MSGATEPIVALTCGNVGQGPSSASFSSLPNSPPPRGGSVALNLAGRHLSLVVQQSRLRNRDPAGVRCLSGTVAARCSEPATWCWPRPTSDSCARPTSPGFGGTADLLGSRRPYSRGDHVRRLRCSTGRCHRTAGPAAHHLARWLLSTGAGRAVAAVLSTGVFSTAAPPSWGAAGRRTALAPSEFGCPLTG